MKPAILTMTTWRGPLPLPGQYLATARGRISYLVLEVRRPKNPYVKVKYVAKFVCERRPIGEPGREQVPCYEFYWHPRRKKRR